MSVCDITSDATPAGVFYPIIGVLAQPPLALFGKLVGCRQSDVMVCLREEALAADSGPKTICSITAFA